ncbi:excinuclease ABC subunit UvrC [Myxococcota bacterium]|nr:excinuclease ABC subunit UvrC [Myxococcota bacterium]
MAFDPETDLDRIATEPGVYLMKDRDGVIFYVGKAANLRARLRQYFGATSDRRFFVGLLDRLLADVEVVITLTEKEALILENELIKKHQPRFNVELKDDKSFLHLRIDDRAEWPRIDVVRRPKKDGARYFGPYHSASKIRETLKVVERHFQLRNCDDLTFKNRARPCLQYQIGRCPGPCVLPVDRDEYQRGVQAVALFLQGKRGELVERLRDQMERAAEDLEFERAARYRDQMQAVSGSLEHQQIIQGAAIDQDVFGLYRQGSHVDVAALFVRKGRLQGSRTFSFADQEVPDTEVLGSFLNLYYHAGNDVPDEVVLPLVLESAEALTERLAELAGRRVVLRAPSRGPARRLVEMAEKNAEQAFFQARRAEAMQNGALVKLKHRLRLANLPFRIECYDISIFQGAAPVASRVVFEGGVPKRADYRHYKIRDVEGTDDFAMMREVLMRRLKRGVGQQDGHEGDDLPDLLVVDGGKGQLGVATTVAADLGITGVDIVGLAKSRVQDGQDAAGGAIRSSERVFLPGRKDPIPLLPHTDELHLMTYLRDEAHRFAITFHRHVRQTSTLRTMLDDIPGIGPSRRRALLRRFGSAERVAAATEAEIAAVPGIGPVRAAEITAFLGSADPTGYDGASTSTTTQAPPGEDGAEGASPR